MHGVPKVFELLPHVPYLQQEILSRIDIKDPRYETTALALGQLPYSFNSTMCSLFDLLRIAEEGTEEVLPATSGTTQFFALKDVAREKIAHRIDSFFDAAVRTQNALVPYLSTALSLSLPMSMNDLVKSIQAGKSNLDQRVGEVFDSYWQKRGKTLRDYRDLIQHHAILFPEATALRGPKGEQVLVLLLPNNPEIKNRGKLKFDEPVVHAIEYLVREMKNLTRLCHLVIKPLTREAKIERLIVEHHFFHRPLGTDISGIVLGEVEEVALSLRRYAESLRRS